MDVRSERRFHFDAPPATVWAAFASVEDYPRWWPWLRSFDADGLVAGDEWRCTVRPPLPYSVRFTVHLDDVVPEQHVAARVSGDIVGQALLDLSPAGAGSEMWLRSELRPANRLLRFMSVAGRLLVRYGHDWVLDVGAGQFATRAL